ncbi:VC0807 family protein [Halobacteriovorax sp. JY17]|uniref:VC0807 family protein n=1 Tax=Halobacteriovorax sp. JY17 TaxID=2014617 RepID=UPI000C664AAF|nr:VC0807 family protein [Halobacteriovorax sp. JY17]PIK15360.1 MAG: MFS transporter [Halobacteriovorax sp. JY17]
MNAETAPKKKQENSFLNIALNVIIPSVILTKFSSDQHLGQVYSLILALSFPIGYGAYDYFKQRKINFFSALGLFSVIMTGGIGLFNLNRDWMVAKETGIPLLMGIAVIISQFTTKPLVKTFLGQMIDIDLIDKSFKDHGHVGLFEKNLKVASLCLGGTFFISALLNYILAIKILVGEPGTVEFNESLGKMTALSFPVISVPMVIMVGLIIGYLVMTIKKNTDLEIESILRQ